MEKILRKKNKRERKKKEREQLHQWQQHRQGRKEACLLRHKLTQMWTPTFAFHAQKLGVDEMMCLCVGVCVHVRMHDTCGRLLVRLCVCEWAYVRG